VNQLYTSLTLLTFRGEGGKHGEGTGYIALVVVGNKRPWITFVRVFSLQARMLLLITFSDMVNILRQLQLAVDRLVE